MVVDLLEVNLLHPAIGGLGRPVSLLSLDGLALVDRAKSDAKGQGSFACT